jgi:hypothetical protein
MLTSMPFKPQNYFQLLFVVAEMNVICTIIWKKERDRYGMV